MQKIKTIWPFFIFIAAVVIIAVVFGINYKNRPTKERYDLNTFFGVSDKEHLAIMVDDFLLEEQAFYEDDIIYVSFDTVTDYICERFFWDEELQCIIYVTPEGPQILKQEDGYKIVSNTVFMSWELVTEYAQINQNVYSNPNRIIVQTDGDAVSFAKVKKASEIRYRAGVESPILKNSKGGEVLKILDTVDDWTHVVSEDGCIGYIKTDCLGETYKDSYTIENEDMVYPTLSLGEKVCMGWHQMTSYAGNDTLDEKLAQVKGLNVISPTWFFLSDDSGTINSIASADYVNKCHNLGIQVWALVENITYDVDEYEVFSKYSIRQRVIDSLISECLRYGIDGINVDFESLAAEAGPGYIQFIRELSVECHKNDIILSVDNYVPYNFNSFYAREEQAVFADYVIVMSYDEHLNEETGAGSVSSLGYVDYAISKMLEEVPKEKLINAIPFYTRLWIETPKSDREIAAESANEDYSPYKLSWQTLGMTQAKEFVEEQGIELLWYDESAQYYGEYTEDGEIYKIWLEDARSLEEKLKLVKEYNIAGVAAWKLGFETSEIWDIINQYYPE